MMLNKVHFWFFRKRCSRIYNNITTLLFTSSKHFADVLNGGNRWTNSRCNRSKRIKDYGLSVGGKVGADQGQKTVPGQNNNKSNFRFSLG
jgi:hypothetical protein